MIFSIVSKRPNLPNVNYNIRTVIRHGRVLNKRRNVEKTKRTEEKQEKWKKSLSKLLSKQKDERKNLFKLLNKQKEKEPFSKLRDERWFSTELPSLHLNENQIEK